MFLTITISSWLSSNTAFFTTPEYRELVCITTCMLEYGLMDTTQHDHIMRFAPQLCISCYKAWQLCWINWTVPILLAAWRKQDTSLMSVLSFGCISYENNIYNQQRRHSLPVSVISFYLFCSF